MKMQSNNNMNAAYYYVYRHLAAGLKDKVAIYFNEKKITYAELAEQVNDRAIYLKNLGVDSEQRVALLLRDTPEFIFWFMACLQVGAVAVPLNTFAKADLIDYCLEDSRAKYLVAHSDDKERLSEIKVLAGDKIIDSDTVNITTANMVVNVFPMHEDDSAFWLYTSGSTGMPKAVVHRHGGMRVCSDQYANSILNITEKDICFSTSKMFFAYGLGNSILFPFSVGASCVLNEDKISAADVVNKIKQFNPSILFSVPAVYNLLLSSGVVNSELLNNVRLCISAGEYLPTSVFDKWLSVTNKRIFDGIGSTEAMHIFCSNSEGSCKSGTSGKAVPGYELKIVSDDGVAVKQGDVGQLVVRGMTFAKEYWHQYEKSTSTFVGDCLYTGDLYRMDDEGYYIYEGRKNDAFKSSGLWVTPVEIEQTLLGHENVVEAAVVPYKNNDGFYVPRAFVVLAKSESDSLNENDIKAFLSGRLSKYKMPEQIDILQEMPKTATGKIARAELHSIS